MKTSLRTFFLLTGLALTTTAVQAQIPPPSTSTTSPSRPQAPPPTQPSAAPQVNTPAASPGQVSKERDKAQENLAREREKAARDEEKARQRGQN